MQHKKADVSSKKEFPLLQGKRFEESSLIYVCKNYSCKKPIEDVKEIKSLVKLMHL